MNAFLFVFFEKTLFSLRMLNEWKSCETARTTKHMVRPVKNPFLLFPITKATIASEPISNPSKIIRSVCENEKRGCVALIGGRFITSSLAGSNPKAIAGRESVVRFTHKS